MKKSAVILILASMVLVGCSSGKMDKRTQYLNTAMQSPVSGVTKITVPADSLIKKDGVRNTILYPLRPKPGYTFHDDLEKKFTATTMYINLSPGTTSRTAEISGEINYYDVERYENSKLVGDVTKSVPIAVRKVNISADKPTLIELPRGIRFSVQLSENPDGQPGNN